MAVFHFRKLFWGRGGGGGGGGANAPPPNETLHGDLFYSIFMSLMLHNAKTFLFTYDVHRTQHIIGSDIL